MSSTKQSTGSLGSTQGVLLWKQIVDSTTDFHSPKLRGRPILREVQNLSATTATMIWTLTLIYYAFRIMYIYIRTYVCAIYCIDPNAPLQKCEQQKTCQSLSVCSYLRVRVLTYTYTHVCKHRSCWSNKHHINICIYIQMVTTRSSYHITY